MDMEEKIELGRHQNYYYPHVRISIGFSAVTVTTPVDQ